MFLLSPLISRNNLPPIFFVSFHWRHYHYTDYFFVDFIIIIPPTTTLDLWDPILAQDKLTRFFVIKLELHDLERRS